MQTGSVTASGNLADRWSVISAAIILWTFGALFFAALSIYLGGAADAFGLSAREIGFLGSSYLAGFVVAGVVAVAWLPRVNWRVGTASGGAVAIGACAVSVTAANYNVLLLLLFVLGCGKGTVYAVCFRILGAATDPDRIFGIANTLQIILQAACVFAFSTWVMPSWGFTGFTLAIAAALAVMLGSVPVLPRNPAGMGKVQTAGDVSAMPLAIWLSQFAMVALFIGVTGMWAFTERMGVDAGFGSEAIGQVVSAALLALGAGSLVAAVQSTRWGRFWPLVLGCTGLAAAFVALGESTTFNGYVASVLAYNFGWGYVLTFVFGIIADADLAGRFTGAIGASQGIGAALGPAFTGLVIAGTDYSGAVAICSIAAVVCLIASAAGIRLLQPPPRWQS